VKLTDRLLAQIEADKLPPRRAAVVVAVSGGVDSVSLLHLLIYLASKYDWRLVVAHLNHQLRRGALADERWVQALGRRLGLPVVVGRTGVRELARRRRLTIEEAGRVARYDFLERVARRQRAKVIAVAHTADDQVETVVMNWLRGAGVRGLAGMHQWEGHIWRPLLRVWKRELRQLARTLHFGCREDRTNRQVTYTRNRIRHRLLPAMERINPQVREVILRNAENLTELESWLDTHLVQARQAVKLRRGHREVHWRLVPFLKLHPYLQSELLLEAVGELQGNRQNYKAVHVFEMRKVIDSRHPRSFKQLPGKLFLIKAYDKISVSRFKPSSL